MTGIIQDGVISENRWHHIAVVYDGSVHRIYINGVEQTLSSGATSTWLSVVGHRIGMSDTSAGFAFKGAVDELVIYDQVLDSRQLGLRYQQTSNDYIVPMSLSTEKTILATYSTQAQAVQTSLTPQTDNVIINISNDSSLTDPTIVLQWPSTVRSANSAAQFAYRLQGSTGAFTSMPVTYTGDTLNQQVRLPNLANGTYDYQVQYSNQTNLKTFTGVFVTNFMNGISQMVDTSAIISTTEQTITAQLTDYLSSADIAVLSSVDAKVMHNGITISEASTDVTGLAAQSTGYAGSVNLAIGQQLAEGSYSVELTYHYTDNSVVMQPQFSHTIDYTPSSIAVENSSGDLSLVYNDVVINQLQPTVLNLTNTVQPANTNANFKYRIANSSDVYTNATVTVQGANLDISLTGLANGNYEFVMDFTDTSSGDLLKTTTGIFTSTKGSASTTNITFVDRVPNNPAFYFDFNEGSGNTTKEMIGNTDSTLAGVDFAATGWTSGVNGNALQFDGQNDHINFDDQRIATAPFTASTWINASDLTHANQWFGMGVLRSLTGGGAIGDYYVAVDNDGAVRFSHWTDNTLSTSNAFTTNDAVITQGQWHHVAVSWDGSSHKIYVDGVDQLLSASTSGDGWEPGAGIGRLYDLSADNHFKGSIDDVALFNQSLNLSQINTLHQHSGLAVNTPVTVNINNATTFHDPVVKLSWPASFNLTNSSSYVHIRHQANTINYKLNIAAGATSVDLSGMINGLYDYSIFIQNNGGYKQLDGTFTVDYVNGSSQLNSGINSTTITNHHIGNKLENFFTAAEYSNIDFYTVKLSQNSVLMQETTTSNRAFAAGLYDGHLVLKYDALLAVGAYDAEVTVVDYSGVSSVRNFSVTLDETNLITATLNEADSLNPFITIPASEIILNAGDSVALVYRTFDGSSFTEAVTVDLNLVADEYKANLPSVLTGLLTASSLQIKAADGSLVQVKNIGLDLDVVSQTDFETVNSLYESRSVIQLQATQISMLDSIRPANTYATMQYRLTGSNSVFTSSNIIYDTVNTIPMIIGSITNPVDGDYDVIIEFKDNLSHAVMKSASFIISSELATNGSATADFAYDEPSSAIVSGNMVDNYIPAADYSRIEQIEAHVFSGATEIATAMTKPQEFTAAAGDYQGQANLSMTPLPAGNYTVTLETSYKDTPVTLLRQFVLSNGQLIEEGSQLIRWPLASMVDVAGSSSFHYRLTESSDWIDVVPVINGVNIEADLGGSLQSSASYEFELQQFDRLGFLQEYYSGSFTVGNTQVETLSFDRNVRRTESSDASANMGSSLFYFDTDSASANYTDLQTVDYVEVVVRDYLTETAMNGDEPVVTYMDPLDPSSHVNLTLGYVLMDGKYYVDVTVYFNNGNPPVQETFNHEQGDQVPSYFAAGPNEFSSGETQLKAWVQSQSSNANGLRQSQQFYDNSGRLTGSLDGENYLSRFEYDHAGRVIRTTAYELEISETAVSSMSNIDDITPLSVSIEDQQSYTLYDGKGQIKAVIDGLGFVTSSDYDEAGNVVSTTQHAVLLTQSQINAAITSAGGLTSLQFSDLAIVSHVDDQTTTNKFDKERNRLESVTDYRNVTTKYYYNDANQVVQVTHGMITGLDGSYNEIVSHDGRDSINIFDTLGQLREEFTPLALASAQNNTATAHKLIHDYDDAGRRISTTDTTPTVDDNGNYIQQRKTRFYYNANSQLVYSINAADEVSGITYNGFGQQIETRQFANKFGDEGKPVLTLDESKGGLLGTDLIAKFNSLSDSINDIRTQMEYNKRGMVAATRNSIETIVNETPDPAKNGEIINSTETTYNAFGEVDQLIEYIRNKNNYTSNTRTSTFTYDNRGQVTKTSVSGLTTKDGLTTETVLTTRTFYDAFGRVTKSIDANDNAANIEYRLEQLAYNGDTTGRYVEVMTDSQAKYSRVVYDAFGRTIRQVDRLGHVTEMTYTVDSSKDKGEQAVSVYQVPNGIAWDGSKTIIENRELGWDFSHSTTSNRFGESISSVDANGHDGVSSIMDANGNVIEVTVSGDVWENGVKTTKELKSYSTYDDANRLLYTRDAKGLVTEFIYDEANRVVKKIIDGKYFDGTNYVNKTNDYSLPRKENNGFHITTEYEYDNFGRQIKITEKNTLFNSANPVGINHDRVTQTFYDQNGNVRAVVVDPKGLALVKVFEFDSQGQSLKSYEGKLSSIVLDDDGTQDIINKLVIERESTTEFDALGSRTSEQVGNDNPVTFAYDDNGNVIQRTNSNGSLSYFAYDSLNQQRFAMHQADASGTEFTVAETVFNANGQMTQTINYKNTVTLTVAPQTEANVSVVATPGEDQTQFLYYDDLGRISRGVNALGYVTESLYDAVGNVIESKLYADSVDTSAKKKIIGNGNGTSTTAAPLSLSDTSRTTHQAYDNLNRLVYAVDPMGYVTETRYDERSQVEKVVQWATAITGVTDYSVTNIKTALSGDMRDTETRFDLLGRTESIIDAKGNTESYDLDDLGQRLTLTNAKNVTWQYVYDKAGRLEKEISPEVDVHGYDHATVRATTEYMKVTVLSGDLPENVISEVAATGGSWITRVSDQESQPGEMLLRLDKTVVTSIQRDDTIPQTVQLVHNGIGTSSVTNINVDVDFLYTNTYLQIRSVEDPNKQVVASMSVDLTDPNLGNLLDIPIVVPKVKAGDYYLTAIHNYVRKTIDFNKFLTGDGVDSNPKHWDMPLYGDDLTLSRRIFTTPDSAPKMTLGTSVDFEVQWEAPAGTTSAQLYLTDNTPRWGHIQSNEQSAPALAMTAIDKTRTETFTTGREVDITIDNAGLNTELRWTAFGAPGATTSVELYYREQNTSTANETDYAKIDVVKNGFEYSATLNGKWQTGVDYEFFIHFRDQEGDIIESTYGLTTANGDPVVGYVDANGVALDPADTGDVIIQPDPPVHHVFFVRPEFSHLTSMGAPVLRFPYHVMNYANKLATVLAPLPVEAVINTGVSAEPASAYWNGNDLIVDIPPGDQSLVPSYQQLSIFKIFDENDALWGMGDGYFGETVNVHLESNTNIALVGSYEFTIKYYDDLGNELTDLDKKLIVIIDHRVIPPGVYPQKPVLSAYSGADAHASSSSAALAGELDIAWSGDMVQLTVPTPVSSSGVDATSYQLFDINNGNEVLLNPTINGYAVELGPFDNTTLPDVLSGFLQYKVKYFNASGVEIPEYARVITVVLEPVSDTDFTKFRPTLSANITGLDKDIYWTQDDRIAIDIPTGTDGASSYDNFKLFMVHTPVNGSLTEVEYSEGIQNANQDFQTKIFDQQFINALQPGKITFRIRYYDSVGNEVQGTEKTMTVSLWPERVQSWTLSNQTPVYAEAATTTVVAAQEIVTADPNLQDGDNVTIAGQNYTVGYKDGQYVSVKKTGKRVSGAVTMTVNNHSQPAYWDGDEFRTNLNFNAFNDSVANEFDANHITTVKIFDANADVNIDPPNNTQYTVVTNGTRDSYVTMEVTGLKSAQVEGMTFNYQLQFIDENDDTALRNAQVNFGANRTVTVTVDNETFHAYWDDQILKIHVRYTGANNDFDARNIANAVITDNGNYGSIAGTVVDTSTGPVGNVNIGGWYDDLTWLEGKDFYYTVTYYDSQNRSRSYGMVVNFTQVPDYTYMAEEHNVPQDLMGGSMMHDRGLVVLTDGDAPMIPLEEQSEVLEVLESGYGANKATKEVLRHYRYRSVGQVNSSAYYKDVVTGVETNPIVRTLPYDVAPTVSNLDIPFIGSNQLYDMSSHGLALYKTITVDAGTVDAESKTRTVRKLDETLGAWFDWADLANLAPGAYDQSFRTSDMLNQTYQLDFVDIPYGVNISHLAHNNDSITFDVEGSDGEILTASAEFLFDGAANSQYQTAGSDGFTSSSMKYYYSSSSTAPTNDTWVTLNDGLSYKVGYSEYGTVWQNNDIEDESTSSGPFERVTQTSSEQEIIPNRDPNVTFSNASFTHQWIGSNQGDLRVNLPQASEPPGSGFTLYTQYKMTHMNGVGVTKSYQTGDSNNIDGFTLDVVYDNTLDGNNYTYLVEYHIVNSDTQEDIIHQTKSITIDFVTAGNASITNGDASLSGWSSGNTALLVSVNGAQPSGISDITDLNLLSGGSAYTTASLSSNGGNYTVYDVNPSWVPDGHTFNYNVDYYKKYIKSNNQASLSQFNTASTTATFTYDKHWKHNIKVENRSNLTKELKQAYSPQMRWTAYGGTEQKTYTITPTITYNISETVTKYETPEVFDTFNKYVLEYYDEVYESGVVQAPSEPVDLYVNQYAVEYRDVDQAASSEETLVGGFNETSSGSGIYSVHLPEAVPGTYAYRIDYEQLDHEQNAQPYALQGMMNVDAHLSVLNTATTSGPENTPNITTYMQYDSLGNVTSRQEAYLTSQQRTTDYLYDDAGRQTITQQYNAPDIITQETYYNAVGQAVAHRDVNGHYSYKVYDTNGRIVYEIDQEQYVTGYIYDEFGNQSSMTRYALPISFNQADYLQGATVSAVKSAITFVQSQNPTVDENRTITYTYDALNRQRESTLDVVEYLTFNVNNNNEFNVFNVSTAKPKTVVEYNAFGERVEETTYTTATETNVTRYYYNDRGEMIGQLDPEDYFTEFYYNAFGNRTRQKEYATALKDIDQVFADSVDKKTAFDAIKAKYISTENTGRERHNEKDRITEYGYDQLGQLTKETKVGVAYYLQDTSLGERVSSQLTGQDLVTEYLYDEVGNQVEVIDPEKNKSYLFYDNLGRQIATVSPYHQVDIAGQYKRAVSTMEYDALGSLIRTTRHANGMGDLAWGNTLSAIQALAADAVNDQIDSNYYDSLGRVVTNVDAGGVMRRKQYYNSGNLKEESFRMLIDGDEKEARVVYGYDKVGRQDTETVYFTNLEEDANLNRYGYKAQQDFIARRTEYNAFGEITAKGIVGDNTDYESYRYDKAGRVWYSTDGDGVKKMYTYNLVGASNGSTISLDKDLSAYQSLGALITDFESNTAKLRYSLNKMDKLGRATVQYGTGKVDNGVTYLPMVMNQYDRWGNVIRTDAGDDMAVVEKTYDHNNRVMEEKILNVSYTDATGTAHNNQNLSTYYRYNNLGQQIDVKDANNHHQSTIYNAIGQKLKEVNGVGGIRSYAYDVLGREVTFMDEVNRITRREYDQKNQVIKQTTATQEVRYEYDANGNRVKEIQEMGEDPDLVTHHIYNERGDLLESRLPMYQSYRTVDDLKDEIESSRFAGVYDAGSLIGQRLYSTMNQYDVFGNKLKMIDGNGRVLSTSFEDGDYFGRVRTKMDLGGRVTTYTYDAYTKLLDKESIAFQLNGQSVAATRQYEYVETTGQVESITTTSPYITKRLRYFKESSQDRERLLPVFEDQQEWNLEDIQVYALQHYNPSDNLGPYFLERTDGNRIVKSEYSYDIHGRRKTEKTTHTETAVYAYMLPAAQHGDGITFSEQVIQDVVVDYDKMGRISTFTDSRTDKPEHVLYSYDAVGNRRFIRIHDATSTSSNLAHDYWYTYDAANQVIINEGHKNENNQIVLTEKQGEQYEYYTNGQRKSVTMLEKREDSNPEPQADIYYIHQTSSQDTGATKSTYKDVQHYSYDADGRLSKVTRQSTNQSANLGFAKTLVTRTYDAVGRLVHETNEEDGSTFRKITYNDNGSVVHNYNSKTKADDHPNKTIISEVLYDGDKAAGYDGAGNVLSYQVKQIQYGSGFESYHQSSDYSIRYSYFDSYKEAGTLAIEYSNGHSAYQGGDPMKQPGSTHFMYDAWGNEVLWMDVTKIPEGYTKNRISFYRHAADGKILTKHLIDGMDVNDLSDHKKLSDDYNYLFNNETIGSMTSKRGEGGEHEEFIYNFSPVVSGMETQLPSTEARYITNGGDTLGNIARTMYGDSSLWYLIADANGLSSNEGLRPGMSLKIPAATGQVGNSSGIFKTYNPGEIIGDTQVTQAMAPPTPIEGLSKCQQAVVLIVTVVVSYYSGSGGLGNIVGQIVHAMMDIHYQFDLEAAAKAQAIGMITQGVGKYVEGAANAASAGASSTAMAAIEVAAAVASSVISQGVSMALGLQDEFSWGSAVAAGVMSTIPLAGLAVDNRAGFSFAELAREALKGIAREVITQSVKVAIDRKGKMDYATIAANAFGHALGNSITIMAWKRTIKINSTNLIWTKH